MIVQKEIYHTLSNKCLITLETVERLKQKLKKQVKFYWKGEITEIRVMNDLIDEVFKIEKEK